MLGSFRGRCVVDQSIGRRNRGVFMAKGQRPRVRERHDFDFRSNNNSTMGNHSIEMTLTLCKVRSSISASNMTPEIKPSSGKKIEIKIV